MQGNMLAETDSKRGRPLMPASTTAAIGDPFLLPVCDCGGPMNLASLEPHAARPDLELKTYKCLHCGTQQVFTVQKRVVKKAL
jgi:hypothetical protein